MRASLSTGFDMIGRTGLASLQDAFPFWSFPVVSLADSLNHRLRLSQSLRLARRGNGDIRRYILQDALAFLNLSGGVAHFVRSTTGYGYCKPSACPESETARSTTGCGCGKASACLEFDAAPFAEVAP